MKRFAYFTAAVISFMTISVGALPQTAIAQESSTNVTLSQTILPPACYDTVSVTETSTDYISVWECELQRP